MAAILYVKLGQTASAASNREDAPQMDDPQNDEPTPGAGNNRLTVLAADIKAAHAGVLDAAKTAAAERAIEAGRALLEAKGLVKHGQWLPWLQQHCGMSERTAQLYVQIAKLELPAKTIAVMGLKAAAKAVIFEDHGYNRFHCDVEATRQWHLFVAFGAPWPHVEWLLNKQFITPDEWLGPEGEKWRRAWGEGGHARRVQACVGQILSKSTGRHRCQRPKPWPKQWGQSGRRRRPRPRQRIRSGRVRSGEGHSAGNPQRLRICGVPPAPARRAGHERAACAEYEAVSRPRLTRRRRLHRGPLEPWRLPARAQQVG